MATALVPGLPRLAGRALAWTALAAAGLLLGLVGVPLAVSFGLLARTKGGWGRRLAATGFGLAALTIVWLAANLVALAVGDRREARSAWPVAAR